MFDNVLTENIKLVNNGIYYKLSENNYDEYHYDDEDESIEDIRGQYFISFDKLKNKPVREIFEFLTNHRGAFFSNFYDLSIKLKDENKKYVYLDNYYNEEINRLYLKIKRDGDLKYLLDYNLVQLLDLVAHNHHAKNINVINLKDSDTKYDEEQDDLVHDKTFSMQTDPSNRMMRL